MDKRKQYWKTTLTYLSVLLILWFVVALLCPIVLVDQLNQLRIGGFPLGIWFAFQGSIIFLVVLIFVYNYLMNRLEKKYDIKE